MARSLFGCFYCGRSCESHVNVRRGLVLETCGKLGFWWQKKTRSVWTLEGCNSVILGKNLRG